MWKHAVILLWILLFPLQACQTSHEVNVAPVEIKPIYITIDVNVKIDKDLDDFFGDIDEAGEQMDITPSAAQ